MLFFISFITPKRIEIGIKRVTTKWESWNITELIIVTIINLRTNLIPVLVFNFLFWHVLLNILQKFWFRMHCFIANKLFLILFILFSNYNIFWVILGSWLFLFYILDWNNWTFFLLTSFNLYWLCIFDLNCSLFKLFL